MKIYQYFSLHNNCNVTVSYSDGILISVEYENMEPDKKEQQLMVSAFCFEAEFLRMSQKAKVKVTEIKREITFDMFYEKYANKIGKHEATKAWQKLSDKDKQEAYDWIPVYNSILKQNPVSRLYPATYLNAKRWIK